jgi:3-oxocholest-4-en-26-oyl-CoA dehydrogenase beta subunit
MDFDLSPEQEDLRDLTRRILQDHAGEERQRQTATMTDGYDVEAWRALAKADILGIAFPPDAGGGGYGLIEQCVILQELGRTLVAVPLLASCVLGGHAVARYGTVDQVTRWAMPAAEGERILTAALSEPASHNPLVPQLRAFQDGDGWRLEGVKTRVPAGTLADAVVVPATIDGEVGMFVVDASATDMKVVPQATTDGTIEGYLELDGVHVSAANVLGSTDTGGDILRWLVQRATVGLCAFQLGICERALEMTIEYTKSRQVFGRPTGTFQAVGHRVADAFVSLEAMRTTLWQAVWLTSQNLPSDIEIATAKWWAADGGHRIAHTAVHLHGGIGIDRDYPLHRYLLAAKQAEFTLGGATQQLLTIGDAFADQGVDALT